MGGVSGHDATSFMDINDSGSLPVSSACNLLSHST